MLQLEIEEFTPRLSNGLPAYVRERPETVPGCQTALNLGVRLLSGLSVSNQAGTLTYIVYLSRCARCTPLSGSRIFSCN